MLLEACDLYAPQGVDLGEGGSLSYWHDTVKSDWPWLQNVKRSRKLMAKLTGRYIKILQLQLPPSLHDIVDMCRLRGRGP